MGQPNPLHKSGEESRQKTLYEKWTLPDHVWELPEVFRSVKTLGAVHLRRGACTEKGIYVAASRSGTGNLREFAESGQTRYISAPSSLNKTGPEIFVRLLISIEKTKY